MRWQNRAHFFAVSAQLMRRILVDHARRHNQKRGAGIQHVSLEAGAMIGGDRGADLVALDEALQTLARLDPRNAPPQPPADDSSLHKFTSELIEKRIVLDSCQKLFDANDTSCLRQ
jgi:hypothetical protein